MKYLSIDVETTGLDPDVCQILQIAMVLDGGSNNVEALPYFYTNVRHPLYVGEPYALAMNSDILYDIDRGENVIDIQHLAHSMNDWLYRVGVHRSITVAGKNVAGFDFQFIKRIPMWENRFASRTIDPSLYYLKRADEKLPSLSTCKQRAGLLPTVAHDALEDARDVVRLIRNMNLW